MNFTIENATVVTKIAMKIVITDGRIGFDMPVNFNFDPVTKEVTDIRVVGDNILMPSEVAELKEWAAKNIN